MDVNTFFLLYGGIKAYTMFLSDCFMGNSKVSDFILKEDYFYTRLEFTDETFIKHLEELKEKSIYDTGINIDKTNKLLILQTCSQDEDGLYLVIGAKLKEKL